MYTLKHLEMKSIKLLLLGLILVGCASPQQKTDTRPSLSVLDFGAVPDGVTDCTDAINSSIDSCSAVGGVLVFPEGTYRCRTVYLKDNVELRLEKGAVLQGVEDAALYDHFVPRSDLSRYDSGQGSANSNCASDTVWMKAMIIGNGVRNTAITGEGTIDGLHVFNPEGEEGMRGPHTIVIAEATGFRLEGVTITRAANYAFLGYALDSALFRGVHITEGWDGIHIRGAKHVEIDSCTLETGDDCIAGGYWEDMLIHSSDINSSCNGIRLIMPADGVEVRDCHFHGPGNYPHRTSGEARRNNMLFGIILQPGGWGSAPGDLDNVWLHDLTMDSLSSPLSVSISEEAHGRNLKVENITATHVLGTMSPIVCWNDSGFDHIEVNGLNYSK